MTSGSCRFFTLTAPGDLAALQGRTWVTRKGIHVDRIACAWLIRRFIDPGAQLKLVPGKDYKPQPGELRYDMFEAEFTHEGDLCSFEVMLKRCDTFEALFEHFSRKR